MKRLKQIQEEIAMSATGVSGGGPIAGLPPDFPPVAAGVKTGSSMLRRSSFGKMAVFKVPPDRFYKARLGKKKFEHYSSYVGRDEIGEEIRAYIKENPNAPVILEDEITGAMFYLKHGKR
jgi:hypothetical protein